MTTSRTASGDHSGQPSGGEPEVLADRYQLDSLIGSGGMADVYRGTDQVLLRPIAVKLLRDVADPVSRERFVQEARTLASLNHPGLVTLLDAGVEEERPYLVMEMVEGLTLTERLAEGPVPDDEARAIGSQLAAALQYAHDQGVVHRDVKPSNVLLAEGRALLVDFGIARLIGNADQHTRTGETIGSPAYLSPEQVVGEPIAGATDVYSLGLVLLEALTTVRAYSGSAVESAVARVHAAPAIPTSLGAEWRDLITQMTDRDPAARPTAGEVCAFLTGVPQLDATQALDLRAAAEETQAVPVVPLAADEPVFDDAVVERPRRSRRLAAAGLVLLLALVAGTVVALVQGGPDPATATDDSSTVVPATVPAAFRARLEQLHEAVAAVEDRAPALVPRLEAVDAALSRDARPAGRTALAKLVATARSDRAAGRITSAEQARIVTPAQQLSIALAAGTTPAGQGDEGAGANAPTSPATPTAKASAAVPSATPQTGQGPGTGSTPTTEPVPSDPPPSEPPPTEPPPTAEPTGGTTAVVEPAAGTAPQP